MCGVDWFLAIVTLAVKHIALYSGVDFIDVQLRYVRELVAEDMGQVCRVLENVAKFVGNGADVGLVELPVFVAQYFLYLVGHFAGFAA